MMLGPSRRAPNRKRSPFACTLCTIGLLLLVAQARRAEALASPVEITECGQLILTDAVLVADLTCENHTYKRAAIEIGASNVTVDLDGHTLFADPVSSLGIRAENVTDVTVKNGTIDGFLVGITYAESSNMTVENMIVRNLESEDPDEFVFAVWIVGSDGVVVRNCSFEHLPVFHKCAVELYGSTCDIDSAEVACGGCGVDFNFRSRGSVTDSRFVGVVLSGVLVQNARAVNVVDNEFEWSGDGITADPIASGAVNGLTVYGNFIHNMVGVGVHFRGAASSRVLYNVIRDSTLGIDLEAFAYCSEEECFYATGNLISDNEVVDNLLDLHHHELAVGNTWVRNVCETKQGAEIPECGGLGSWPRARPGSRPPRP